MKESGFRGNLIWRGESEKKIRIKVPSLKKLMIRLQRKDIG